MNKRVALIAAFFMLMALSAVSAVAEKILAEESSSLRESYGEALAEPEEGSIESLTSESILIASSETGASLSSSDTFTSDGSSGTDGKSFVGRELSYTIQNPNLSSNIMVACYDWYKKNLTDEPSFDTCFAARQSDFDKCAAYSSWLKEKSYTKDSTPLTQDMDTSAAASGYLDAKYYKNCNGSGGGNAYSVIARQYLIFSKRMFDCDDGSPSWYTYDAEGYVYPSNYDYRDEVSCPVDKKCSEDGDDIYVSTYNGVISNPCRWVDWKSCSLNGDCWSGKCAQSECSPCSVSQCSDVGENTCVGSGQLSTSGQRYCDGTENWVQCTTSSHVGCQKKGDYYCASDAGVWGWRKCPLGCSSGSCVDKCGELTDGQVLTASVTLDPACEYYLPNGVDIWADGVTLDCDGATIRGANLTNAYGIEAYGVRNLVIKNCKIRDYDPDVPPGPDYGAALWLTDLEDSAVLNNEMSNVMIGINFNGSGSDRVLVEGNTIFSARDNGMFARLRDSVIRNNDFGPATIWNGLHLEGRDVLVDNNRFTGPMTLTGGSENITVRANTFAGGPLYIENSDEILIEGNSFEPFEHTDQILVEGSDNLAIKGNTFVATDALDFPNSIHFYGMDSVRNVDIIGNTFQNGALTLGGAEDWAGGENLTITGNLFDESAWVQVDYWDGTYIADNNATRLIYGIQLFGGSNHLVERNILLGRGCTDLSAWPQENCNRVDVLIIDGVENATIRDNTLADAQRSALSHSEYYPGGLTNSSITGNTITNSNAGIRIDKGAAVEISGNTVEASSNALELAGSRVSGNTFIGDSLAAGGSSTTYVGNTLDGVLVEDTGTDNVWCESHEGNLYLHGADYSGPDSYGGTCPPAGDLEVLEVLPIQTVKDVPLIQGKSGLIRTIVNWTSDEVAQINATLTYSLNPAGGGDAIPLGTKIITVSTAEENISLFEFKPLFEVGEYLVSVVVTTTYVDSNLDNNFGSGYAKIINTNPLEVVYVPVGYESGNLESFKAAVKNHNDALNKMYPLADDEINSRSLDIPFQPTGWHTSVPIKGLIDLLNAIYFMGVADQFTMPERVVGIYPQPYEQYWDAGQHTWLTSVQAVIASAEHADSTAHELGHTYNLCDEYDSGYWTEQDHRNKVFGWLVGISSCPNGDYEPPEGLDQTCIDNWGCPLSALSDLVPWAPPGYSGYEDFTNVMGGADDPSPTWIDRPTYLHLITRFQSPTRRIVDNRVYISGLIFRNESGLSVEFNPLVDIGPGEILEGLVPPGNLTIELLDEGEVAIDSVNFTAPFIVSETETNITGFAFVIERHPAVVGIRFKEAEATIQEEHASQNAPSVSIISPGGGIEYGGVVNIIWNASDVDNDTLFHFVSVSPDGGESWHMLVSDYSNTSLVLNLNETLFESSDAFKIRVRTTDGFFSSEATVDVSFSLDPECQDAEGDHVCDSTDNCPEDSNPLQEDFEEDGLGDTCDVDDDNDGVLDTEDICPFSNLPEDVSIEDLRPNHYADVDGDGYFESVDSKTKTILEDALSFNETFGCSCEEIIDEKNGMNKGEAKFGCTKDTLDQSNKLEWGYDG